MSIQYVTGDLLADDADVLVNPVNCVGVMGAGLALAFKRAYPAMFREYAALCAAGSVVPGKVCAHDIGDRMVVNLPTKRHWRDPSRLDDVRAGLEALAVWLGSRPSPPTVALPAVGCGLGGLPWSSVRPIIETTMGPLSAQVRVYLPSR